MFCRKKFKVFIERRQFIGLAAVDGIISGDKVPQLIMGNKAPRHEMVNGKAALTNFLAGIDAADIAANLDDIIPELALLGERSSLGGSREFVGDVWNVRVSCLQEQRKIPIYEVRQDTVVILKILTPNGVDGDVKLRL